MSGALLRPAATQRCAPGSSRQTHHGVMEEQLPGLVKFLIAQHVHEVFQEIPWGQRGCKQGKGGAICGDPQQAQYLTGHEGSTRPLFPPQDRIPPHIP